MTLRRVALLVFGLLLFGLARLPVERQLMREYQAANFFQSQLKLDVRAQTGQMGFVAALSGFRSIVADLVWIRAYTAWENVEWGRMKYMLDTATALQPRATIFWDTAAWHMAWNASVAALQDTKQPREALRQKAAREYIELGEDFLLRGIRFNADRAILFERLGMLYSEKMKDPCKASWAYFEAAKRPDAMAYVHRFAVYQLASCKGHEKESLRELRRLYDLGPQERLPTLLKLLDGLQKELNVPAAERVDITKDLEEATPRAPRRK